MKGEKKDFFKKKKRAPKSPLHLFARRDFLSINDKF